MSFPLLPVAALFGSLVSLCVGTSLAKGLFPVIGAEGTTTLRIVLSMLMLMLLWRPWRRRWQLADLGPLALYGVTLGVMNLLFYSAIRTIPFGLAIAIEFSGPLAVALWTSRRGLDLLWVALAVMGLALILPLPGLDQAHTLDPQGIALAFAAGLCWALYIVFGQRVALRYGPLATPMGMAMAALVVTPLGLAQAGAALFDSRWLLIGLGVALLSSAIPYTLEMFALRHLPQKTFSILLSLEPAVGALAGQWMLAETLRPSQWLAIGFIMAASMGSAWTAGRDRASQSATDAG